jgi:hypothetical protein
MSSAHHAVSIAVELGDAGQAIELGHQVNPTGLSPEPQARYQLDLAQAHAMRRQIGEALHALQEAERIAPEETRVHYVGRAVTRELLQLSGLRPRPELRDSPNDSAYCPSQPSRVCLATPRPRLLQLSP